jgi:hypothetical protein
MKDNIIHCLITQLKKEGIYGLADYEQRLTKNAGDIEVFKDLLFEARAALMFSRHSFKVTIREKPDLCIEMDKEVVYAEVKHFREKEQGRIDEKAMRESDDLVLVGNTVLLEGVDAWQQIANVAIRKTNQYMENAPNLLVVASDSNSISGIILSTAVDIYNKEASKPGNLHLRRLNAFILMDQWIWPGDRLEQLIGAGHRSVIFFPTAHIATPLSVKLANALADIRHW